MAIEVTSSGGSPFTPGTVTIQGNVITTAAGDTGVVVFDTVGGNPVQVLDNTLTGTGAAGTGILLIDHDVALVLDVCDHIYVLDFGRVIAEGDPATIRANRDVADAYLGHTHATAAD